MKFILLLFLFLPLDLLSQKLEFKANKFCYREIQSDSTWGQFGEFIDVNYDVMMDDDPNRIEISDNPKMTYYIVSENKESVTDKGERVISYNCEDSDCDRCYIILIEKSKKEVYMIIYYTNINFLYNIIED
jgi:hypothetical protein